MKLSGVSLCCGEYWVSGSCRRCGRQLRGNGQICAIDTKRGSEGGEAAKGEKWPVSGVSAAKRLGPCKKDRPFCESTFNHPPGGEVGK